jgi:hypothetical protein
MEIMAIITISVDPNTPSLLLSCPQPVAKQADRGRSSRVGSLWNDRHSRLFVWDDDSNVYMYPHFRSRSYLYYSFASSISDGGYGTQTFT